MFTVIFSKYADNCVDRGRDRGFKKEVSNQRFPERYCECGIYL